MSVAVLNLSKKKVSDIIQKIRDVVKAMTGNANYTTPVPPLPQVTTEVDTLETKYQEALNGGKDKKALVRLALATVKNSARTLTGYVQGASEGDEAKILSANFDIKRPRTPAGILPPPANVRCVFGFQAGQIILRWGGVKGKLVYKVQINDTPGDESKWTDYTFTGKNRLIAEELITDKIYAFRIASLSAGGVGSYSDPTSHKAL